MIRHCIVNTKTGRVENVVDYETTLADVPPGFEDHYRALADPAAQIGWVLRDKVLVDPNPPAVVVAPAPASISDRQFFQQLAVAGAITRAEALAAVKTGEIPTALAQVIAALPSDDRFNAEMLLSGATVFSREHSMTGAIGAAMGWSSNQIDALWRAAAAL